MLWRFYTKICSDNCNVQGTLGPLEVYPYDGVTLADRTVSFKGSVGKQAALCCCC